MKAEKGETRMKNMIDRARTLAKIAHAGMKYGEHDYFERHVMDVVDRVIGDENSLYAHVTVAYLHDVVEDTTVTLPELLSLGFGEEIVAAVASISRLDGEDYLNEYIPRVMTNDIASLVKKHDLRSNMNKDTSDSMWERNAKAMEMLK